VRPDVPEGRARAEFRDAVRELQALGVRVVMITEHPGDRRRVRASCTAASR
jgi:cation transport ATPase